MTAHRMRVVESAVREPPYAAGTRSRGWHFALDTARLRQSDTWHLAGAAGIRSVLLRLWVESWDQIPSGSLPGQDAIIAAIIEYPLDLFTVHRAVIMRHWWLATDGRYYHPEITKLVISRVEWKEAERQRKEAYRNRSKASGNVPRDRRGTDAVSHGKDDAGAGAGAGGNYKNKDKVKSIVARKRATVLPEWLDPKVWDAYLEMRTKIKKPLVEGAWEGAFKRLEKLIGQTDEYSGNEILTNCTMNSWQGIYLPKDDHKPQGGPSGKRYETAIDQSERIAEGLTGRKPKGRTFDSD